jgi:hypothetical protein
LSGVALGHGLEVGFRVEDWAISGCEEESGTMSHCMYQLTLYISQGYVPFINQLMVGFFKFCDVVSLNFLMVLHAL